MVLATLSMNNGRRRPIVGDLTSIPKLTKDHRSSRDVVVKKSRKALLKKTEWSRLDFSTFTVKIAPSLVNHSHKIATATANRSSSTSVHLMRGTRKNHSKSKEAVMRVSNGKGASNANWKTPMNRTTKKKSARAKDVNDDRVNSHHDRASHCCNFSSSSWPQDLVQALIEQPGKPRTVDQSGPHVQHPHDHDVILGSGRKKHSGNIAYRVFVWKSRKDFESKINQHEKDKVVERVLQNVLSRKPPGRFLELVHGAFHYVDAPLDRIRIKIGQALRALQWVPPPDLLQRLDRTNDDVTMLHRKAESTPATIAVSKESKLLPDEVTSHPVHGHNPKTTASGSKTLTKKKSSTSIGTTKTIDRAICHGSRLGIYWPLDNVYYNGTVLERVHNWVSLVYDDEETEWIDLKEHQFRVLPSESPAPASFYSTPSTASHARNAAVPAS